MKPSEIENYIEEYVKQMTPSEKIAYQIAREKLESSFDMEKSIGFIEFVKSSIQREDSCKAINSS